MDVESALSKAILDDPDDDLPRLAYADWLEERGGEADEARAELIRHQIAARESERVAELWQRHRTRWFGPAAVRLGPGCCERGFLTGLSVVWLWVLVKAAERADQPWPLGPIPLVDEVTYSRRPWEVERLDEPGIDRAEMNAWPGLASWGGLRLRGSGFGKDRGLTPLRSPCLVNLTSLEVPNSSLMGWRGFFVIAEGVYRLRSLRLPKTSIGNEGVRRLARDPVFSGLRELDLTDATEKLDPVVELLGSANVANLRSLTLSRGGKSVLRALVRSPHLTNLRRLALRGSDFVARSGDLADWTGLARLESLELRGDLTNEGLRLLTHSPHAANLRELTLICWGTRDYLILLASPHLNGLRRLRLGGPAPSELVSAALTAHFGDRVIFDA